MHALDPVERRTLRACFRGWAVDALDRQLYSFLIPTLMVIWNLSTAQAGLLGTSALVSSALGGWVGGILSDRIGRVRVMKVAIAWFFVFTLLCGCARFFEQLLLARVLTGLGFGGEWVAGAVLMDEVTRSEYRGKAVGTVQSGYAGAALLATFLFATIPAHAAWRWMFWLGALPAVPVLLALRGAGEPAAFLAARTVQMTHPTNPRTIFYRSMLATTCLTALLALSVQAGGFSMVIWLPTLLKTAHGLSVVAVGYHSWR